MDNISQERVRLSVAEARELAEQALGRIGYDAEEARIVADHVIDAALCGYEYSGLPKILNVAEHRRLREPRRPMRALGVLAGSGDDVEKSYGYLIIAIKPDLLVPLDDYRRQLSENIERIKAT